MTEYRAGDKVDMTIKGAVVNEVLEGIDGVTPKLYLSYGEGGNWPQLDIRHLAPGVMITKIAPLPKPGEVWDHPDHGRRMVLVSLGEGTIAKPPDDSKAPWQYVEKMEWDGWYRVFPAEDDDPQGPPVPMLRVIEDGAQDRWIETEQDSSVFCLDGSEMFWGSEALIENAFGFSGYGKTVAATYWDAKDDE